MVDDRAAIEADAAKWRYWLDYAGEQYEDGEDWRNVNLTVTLAVDLTEKEWARRAAEQRAVAAEALLELARAALRNARGPIVAGLASCPCCFFVIAHGVGCAMRAWLDAEAADAEARR